MSEFPAPRPFPLHPRLSRAAQLCCGSVKLKRPRSAIWHTALRLLRRRTFATALGLSSRASSPARPHHLLRRQSELVARHSQAPGRARLRASTSSPAANWSACAAPRPKPSRRVVFSGVGKQAWEIDAALNAGILLFNVESEAELELLAERAASLARQARFALRVNPDVFAETHPYISTGLREHKFGIDIRARPRGLSQARRAAQVARARRRQRPHRLADPRRRALRRSHRARSLARRRSCAPTASTSSTIDAGGGLGIDYGTAPTSTPPTASPSMQRHPQRALDGLKRPSAARARPLPRRAGRRAAHARSVHQAERQQAFVITDAAMNDLIRPALYQAHHEIVPVVRENRPHEVADIVGPVCETGDFFARDREIEQLRAGDLVALLDAGAYGMSPARTTTPACGRRRFLSKATSSVSSVVARPSTTSLRRRSSSLPSRRAVESPTVQTLR